MRVVRNIGHVKRRRRLGRWTALVGFLMLASTFFMVFFPKQIVFAYGLLLIGFVSFNFGMQQLGKWSNTPRHPRNDLAIDERLNALSDKYVLLHYIRLGKLVVEHVLIYPGGLLVMTARDVPGTVIGRKNRWRRSGLGIMRMFGMSGPQLGNPVYETEQSITAIESTLRDAQLEYDVYGVLLFTAPTVQLDVEDTDFDAITLTELESFVRYLEVDPAFKTTERDRLVEILGQGEEIERTERTTTKRPVRVKRRSAPSKAASTKP
ncbi:MAG: NERD domain-containing protein [Thermomicrobiales bacterium]|nr:NERD domain-containing protein [Thermomicrobiales bacterium]